MESKRLSKNQSLVRQLLDGGFKLTLVVLLMNLMSALGPSHVAADTTQPGTGTATAVTDPAMSQAVIAACKGSNPPLTGMAMVNCLRGGSLTDPCSTAASNFTDAVSDLSTACNKPIDGSGTAGKDCIDKINSCQDSEDDIANTDDGTDSSSDDGSADDGLSQSQKLCQHVVNITCPQMNSGNLSDYSGAKSDAASALTDAQKNLSDLQNQAQQATAKLQSDTQAAQAKLQSDGLALAAAVKQDELQLSAFELQIDSSKAQTLSAARTKMDGIDAQILALNSAAIQAQSAIANAADDMVASCRSYAQTAYNTDLQTLNQKIQQEDNTIVNLGSGTTIAYYTVRKAKERETAKDKSYTGHFNACMAGIEGDGQTAANKITALKRAAADAAAVRPATLAALNKQKAEAATDLATAEATLDGQLKQQTAQLQADIDTKTSAYTLEQTTTAQQLALENQQTQATVSQLQTQIGQANSALQEAETDKDNASTRYSCFEKYGSTSSTASDNWSKAPGAVSKLNTACGQLVSCSDYATTYKGTCDAVLGRAGSRSTPSSGTTGNQ